MATYNPIIKIFKNRSGDNLIIAGVQVTDGQDFEIPKSQWAKLADNVDIWTPFINAQTVLINDGIGDLIPSDAIQYLQILAIGGGTTEFSFSYNEAGPATTITVPIYQQMIVYQQIEIDDTGVLDLIGDVVIID